MWKSTPEGVLLNVKLIPNAGRDEITGWENDILKVRITAVPEKGKANAHLIRFLAKAFNISKSSISIVKGEKNRMKTLLVKADPDHLSTWYT